MIINQKKSTLRYCVFLLSILIFTACHTEEEKVVNDNPKVQKISLPEGFAIDHIYSPSDSSTGSWVSMTFDDKGRMITSDQFGELYRVEIPAIGSDSIVKPIIEKIALPKAPADTSSNVNIGYAQGLLWANNSLYVMINHRSNEKFARSSGLYRLQDTDGDDQFDSITELLALEGEGEHGPHSVILGPDSLIYVVAGNFTKIPEMDAYRITPNNNTDNLLPYILDTHGHDSDSHNYGGWVARTDAEGKNWELIASGFRNTFDIAFNQHAELFAYDSDMEWDFGMPWYRPTRILHVTSGAEFGWRKGTAKWDASFMDNLPAVLNVGQGSPTNFINAHNAKFPEHYRNSMLAFDWSFGIIYAVQLIPDGATYKAKAEEFISGSPLALTDGLIGPDGALYFLTGGRRLESDLYRVYYKDQDQLDIVSKSQEVPAGVRLRREIEKYHTASNDIDVITKIWPYLGYKDRHIRYAARLALEHQPLSSWKDIAFQETNVVRLTEAMMAMAHIGDTTMQTPMFAKLASIPLEKLNSRMLSNLTRVYEVAISRMGIPQPIVRDNLVAKLEPHYPASNNELNRQLSKLLIALESESAVSKSLDLLKVAKDEEDKSVFMSSSNLILRNPQYGMDIANMLANMPPSQQIFIATNLSAAKSGWTPELREQYFKWFYDGFGFKGGNSYVGFIDNARKLALENVADDMRVYYGKISGDSLLNEKGTRLAEKVVYPKGPGRKWEVDSALKIMEDNSGLRDFKRGKELYIAVKCQSCHTMKGEGGSIGPDLTQLGTRFTKRDMLEAIIEPSKVISDQYESKVFNMKDGTSYLGRLMSEDDQNYVISQNPYAAQLTKALLKKNVKDIKRSEVSIMPPGTLNTMSPDEIRDIMAYLMSGANESNEVYKKK